MAKKCIRCGMLANVDADGLCPDCAKYIRREQEMREADEAARRVAEALTLPPRADGLPLQYSYQDVPVLLPDPEAFDALDPGTRLFGFPAASGAPSAVSLNHRGVPLAYIAPGKLEEMARDFLARGESVLAIIQPHSRSEGAGSVALGFYKKAAARMPSGLKSCAQAKSFRLVGNSGEEMQANIDLCSVGDACDISYDVEKEKYAVDAGLEVGYLPAAGAKFLEENDAEDDYAAAVEDISVNDSGKNVIVVRVGLHPAERIARVETVVEAVPDLPLPEESPAPSGTGEEPVLSTCIRCGKTAVLGENQLCPACNAYIKRDRKENPVVLGAASAPPPKKKGCSGCGIALLAVILLPILYFCIVSFSLDLRNRPQETAAEANQPGQVLMTKPFFDDLAAHPQKYLEKTDYVYGYVEHFYRTEDNVAVLTLPVPSSDGALFQIIFSDNTQPDFTVQPGDLVRALVTYAGNVKSVFQDGNPETPSSMVSSIEIVDQLPPPDVFAEKALREIFDDDFIALKFERNALEVVADTNAVSRSKDPNQRFTFLVYDSLKAIRPLLEAGLSFDAFTVRLTGGLVDEYGNPQPDATTFVASFKTETIKKINFEHLPIDALRPLAFNWLVCKAYRE